MGTVFLGVDVAGRVAAVKRLHPELLADQAARARFRREVALATRVTSSCTAAVLGADIDGLVPHVAFEYVAGDTLARHVRSNGPLPPDQLRPLALGLAEALRAIHAAGVHHRDLSASNVLLTRSGPRVVDFGIARPVESAATAVTGTGLVVGTPGWMPPEQIRGEEPSAAGDVFSWGCLVAFAAGQSPFGEGRPESVLYRTVHESPSLPSLPAPLDTLVARALDKDPVKRPTPAALLDAVLEAEPAQTVELALASTWQLDVGVTPLAQSVTAAMEPSSEITSPVVREAGGGQGASRRRRWLSVLGATALLVVAVAMSTLALRVDDQPSPQSASAASPPPQGTATPATPTTTRPGVATAQPSPIVTVPAGPDATSPTSYFAVDGGDPLLVPSCSGVLSLCLGNPVDRALERFGMEDQRFAATADGGLVRRWETDDFTLSATSDEVDSIVDLTVNLRDGVTASTPLEGIVAGRSTLREFADQMDTRSQVQPYVVGAEGVTIVTLWAWWGPEGSEVWQASTMVDWGSPLNENLLPTPPKDVDVLLEVVGDLPLTSFTVGYEPPPGWDFTLDQSGAESVLDWELGSDAPSWVAEHLAGVGDGWDLVDGGAWVSDATLNAVTGVYAGSATGRGMHVFFFVDDHGYIGRDASEPSNTVSILWRDDDTIAVEYTLYNESDPACCPTGGSTTVRYHWNGENLQPLDTIPPLQGSIHR